MTRKLLAIAAGALVVTAAAPAFAAEATHEVTVTVKRVKALDKHDELSSADDYARVTINGEVIKSPIVKQTTEFEPNWELTAKVPSGKTDVKLELMDRDLARDDPIDINRIGNKRDLDFTVNTRNCRIDGFYRTYRCGDVITRAGTEKKKAEISFTVGVKKLK